MNGTIVVRRLTSFASASTTRLKALWNPLWSILTFSADNIIPPQKSICVSIGKGSISVAYGSRFLSWIKIKGFRIYYIKDEGYPQPEELASTISLAISELKTDKADMTLSIPKEWVVIKRVELPITAKENIPDVISFELDRLTPFSPDDAYYDFGMLKEDDKKLTILLAAAKADPINKYLKLFKEKGIHVSRLTTNLSCLSSLSRYIDRKKDFIFIEINNGGYEGALFIDGFMTDVFIGEFYKDKDISNDNLKVDIIIKEISSYVDAVKKEGRIPQVIAFFKDISPSFRNLLRLKITIPVKILDETDIRLQIPGNPENFPYAAIGGVLETLWQKAKTLNLLKKGFYEKRRTPITLTIILLLISIALGVLYLITPLQIEQKKLMKINNEIAMRKKDIKKFEWLNKDIEQIKKEISDIKGFKEGRAAILNIMGELTTVLLQNAWLTRMHITETTVEVEGYADSALKLLSRFEASRYFKKVELINPIHKDAKKGDRFSIRMEIEGAKKLEAPKDEEGGLLDEGF